MPDTEANPVPVHEFRSSMGQGIAGTAAKGLELGRPGKVGNAPRGKPGNLGRPGGPAPAGPPGRMASNSAVPGCTVGPNPGLVVSKSHNP